MKRAVGIVAMLLLPSCGAVPQQQDAQLRMLETVEKGHLCDPRALTQAIAREHPGVDAETAQRETSHLLYVLGCNLPSLASPGTPSGASGAAIATEMPQDEVHLQLYSGIFAVPVVINGAISIPFVLDSGAADVQLPADVVLTLVRSGTLSEGDFIGESSYILANGSTLRSARFNIRVLRVGDHIVRNVAASVGSVSSDALLGQSFLSRVGSWTLDNRRHVLILAR